MQVKVLYIRNLRLDVTDAHVQEAFEKYGAIERVKRVKNYAFVHFAEREYALNAMAELNGSVSRVKDLLLSYQPITRDSM